MESFASALTGPHGPVTIDCSFETTSNQSCRVLCHRIVQISEQLAPRGVVKAVEMQIIDPGLIPQPFALVATESTFRENWCR